MAAVAVAAVARATGGAGAVPVAVAAGGAAVPVVPQQGELAGDGGGEPPLVTGGEEVEQGFGFTLTDEEPHRSYGHDLVGQNWTLDLRATGADGGR